MEKVNENFLELNCSTDIIIGVDLGHLIGKIIDTYLIGRRLKFEIMKIPKILTIKKNHTIEELYKTVEKVKLSNAISKYAIYFDSYFYDLFYSLYVFVCFHNHSYDLLYFLNFEKKNSK